MARGYGGGHFLTWFWITSIDDVLKVLPGYHLLHFSLEFLAFCVLLRRGLFVVNETQLFASHQLTPSQRILRHPRNQAWFAVSSYCSFPWFTPNSHYLCISIGSDLFFHAGFANGASDLAFLSITFL